FLRQFKNLMVILLLASGSLSLYLRDYETSTILFLIAFINAVIGYRQEHKAETLLASLEKLAVPQAKVVRASKLETINSYELVVGDIVYVEGGDSVPADVRVIKEQELATNDFALTGESNPTRKFVHAITGDVPIANRHNILFMGTTVAIGNGYGVVVGTGMNTELGRIANLSQTAKEDSSPLQKEMDNLSTRLTQGVAILAVLLVYISLQSHIGLKESVLFGISIAAAMIPNGLVAELSIGLAQTASKMAKERALVKKLSAVETLGATDIIATDKTGTLTKNEMTVEKLMIGKTEYGVSGTGYEANGYITGYQDKPLTKEQLKEVELFFETGSLASNAHVNPPDSEHASWYCVGDPTEGALVTLTRKAGIDPDKLNDAHEEIKEFQFDSARKRMSSVRKYRDRLMVFTKGAPESVLERCTHIWDHGHVRPLTQKDRDFFLQYNEKLAGQAMRNLAFAYRALPNGSKPTKMKFDEVEKDLVFLGIVAMVDPLREQVPAAMVAARGAQIKVSIITGDFPTTAKAIARKAKLAPDGQDVTVILGEELPKLSDTQILRLVEQGGAVFSRVAPEDKLRIVELVKTAGHVVAVTGDGINDAPALKRADIGVAMGRTGTDVAKQAASIVLLDDSFSTLVGAIEQGRLTFRNIVKSARCAMTDNSCELAVVLIGLAGQAIFHVPIAILAVQILAVDIVAELFPLTALSWDKAQGDLMHDKPRDLKQHIINVQAVSEFIFYGLTAGILSYANFVFLFMRHNQSPVHFDINNPLYAQATILTYVTIVLCQFTSLLIMRTSIKQRFFSSYIWSNKKLLMAFGISFFCILNIVYNPWVQPFFNAKALSATDWLCAFGAAVIYLLVRLFYRYSYKHSRRAILELKKSKQVAA
ncbi:MAG TPA: cation-transporting P-type ATPase, partial [Patescibacteria group bacterium]|nr:cation-transporting P-type ATPase [Patescibacteria group bacterium]